MKHRTHCAVNRKSASVIAAVSMILAAASFLMTPISVSAQTGSITVGPGGDFTSVQAAIDSPETSEGDTIYVWAGNYTGNIVIDKSITILGNGSSETGICGNQSGSVITVVADWVSISGLSVSGSGQLANDAGILFLSVHNCSLDNTTLTGNRYGVYLSGSSGSVILNNNFINNSYHAYDDGTSIWNRLAPIGGNYWDDAEFPDDANYLLDTPRIIPGGSNRDRRPWAEPSGWESYSSTENAALDSAKLMLLGMAVVYIILSILTFTTYMTGVMVSKYILGKSSKTDIPDEGEAVAAIVAVIKAGE